MSSHVCPLLSVSAVLMRRCSWVLSKNLQLTMPDLLHVGAYHIRVHCAVAPAAAEAAPKRQAAIGRCLRLPPPAPVMPSLLGLAMAAVVTASVGGEAQAQPRLQVEVLDPGPEVCRARAAVGDTLTVAYEGRLPGGKVFDSSKKRHGTGFAFTLGKKEVVRGWEEGLVGMCIGEKRKLTCPPPWAYGAYGSPPVVPPDSTLTFEVELHRLTPGPSKLERLSRWLGKMAPLVLIFTVSSWLFAKGVSTDVGKKNS